MTVSGSSIPTAAPIAPRVGRLARLRLNHPLRLYTWAPAVLLVVVLVTEAASAGEWSWLLLAELPFLLLLAGGLWAAERSTFSPSDVVRTLREAAPKW